MRAELFESLELDRCLSSPLPQQLTNEIRRAVIEGRVRPGARLPSTRTVAGTFALARNTAVAAYEQLVAEGYLETRHGSGTFVVATLPGRSLLSGQDGTRNQISKKPIARLSRQGKWLSQFTLTGLDPTSPPAPFRPSAPALDLFPHNLWNRIRSRIARSLPMGLYTYAHAAGYSPLRVRIADYLRAARGVRCDWNQVIVVSGAQQALDLAARVLLNPGDRAIVEDPGHPGSWAAFRAAGAKLIPVAVDTNGIVVEEHTPLPVARVACVCPSNQYPLGGTLPLRRRLALLEWAYQHSAWILEDDYDSEFRYQGSPLPALQGLDRFDCVLYMGTFSKVLHPALRIGYLVVPNHLISTFTTLKAIADRQPPLLEQVVLASFLEDGHFGRHVRRMRTAYFERQTTLVEGLQQKLSGALEALPAQAGFHIVAWLPKRAEESKISGALQRVGIECPGLSRYAIRAFLRPGLMLGYAGFTPSEIRTGVQALAAHLKRTGLVGVT